MEKTIATFLDVNHLNAQGLIMLSPLRLFFCRLNNPIFQSSSQTMFSGLLLTHIGLIFSHHHHPSLSVFQQMPFLAVLAPLNSNYLIYALPTRVNFPTKFDLNPFKHPFFCEDRKKLSSFSFSLLQ